MALLVPLILLAVTVQAPAGTPRRAVPLGNPGTWITSDDYPTDAAIREAEGRVRFTLAIDAQGRATGCRILESSGDSSLDSLTCKLFVSRGRFQPALDPAGHPSPDTFTTMVSWTLPRLNFAPLMPREAVTVLHFTATGFSHCTEAVNGVEGPRSVSPDCRPGHFLIELMERAMRPRRIVFQSIFRPAGQPAPRVSSVQGALASEEIFEMKIAADGKIEGCRAKSRSYLRPIPALSGCTAALPRADRFEPAADPAAKRRATLTLRTYELKAERPN